MRATKRTGASAEEERKEDKEEEEVEEDDGWMDAETHAALKARSGSRSRAAEQQTDGGNVPWSSRLRPTDGPAGGTNLYQQTNLIIEGALEGQRRNRPDPAAKAKARQPPAKSREEEVLELARAGFRDGQPHPDDPPTDRVLELGVLRLPCRSRGGATVAELRGRFEPGADPHPRRPGGFNLATVLLKRGGDSPLELLPVHRPLHNHPQQRHQLNRGRYSADFSYGALETLLYWSRPEFCRPQGPLGAAGDMTFGGDWPRRNAVSRGEGGAVVLLHQRLNPDWPEPQSLVLGEKRRKFPKVKGTDGERLASLQEAMHLMPEQWRTYGEFCSGMLGYDCILEEDPEDPHQGFLVFTLRTTVYRPWGRVWCAASEMFENDGNRQGGFACEYRHRDSRRPLPNEIQALLNLLVDQSDNPNGFEMLQSLRCGGGLGPCGQGKAGPRFASLGAGSGSSATPRTSGPWPDLWITS